jgi:hypothetical protein
MRGEALVKGKRLSMKTSLAFLLLLVSALAMSGCVSNDRGDDYDVNITRENDRDHPRMATVPPARAVYELP